MGSYPIAPAGLTSSNYAITFPAGTLAITKADQVIHWSNPGAIVFGAPLGTTQFNATVSVIGPAPAGALTYTPAAGTVLPSGQGQVLSVRFTPTDTIDYAFAAGSTTITASASGRDNAKPRAACSGSLRPSAISRRAREIRAAAAW